MMWDQVIQRVKVEVLADATLSGIFATAFRAAGTGEQEIPLIEWTLISDVENELWAPMIFQFDLWTKTAAQCRIAERAMRGLYHQDMPRMLGDLMVWMQYNDGSILAIPDRSNFVGRAVRFIFTPLRSKYVLH